jgi:hypothetical protein
VEIEMKACMKGKKQRCEQLEDKARQEVARERKLAVKEHKDTSQGRNLKTQRTETGKISLL